MSAHRRAVLQVLAALALFALLACGKAGPTDPVWGKEPCAHCKMIVDDRRAAAQVLTADGTTYHFDDFGCLLEFSEEHKLGGAAMWVHEVSTNQWLDAKAARFASGAKTPMDYGFVPDAQGTLAFEEVRSRVLAARKERL